MPKALPAVPPRLAKNADFQKYNEAAQRVHVENQAEFEELASDGEAVRHCRDLEAKLEHEVAQRAKAEKRVEDLERAALDSVADADTVVLHDDEREDLNDRILGLEEQLAALRKELRAAETDRDGANSKVEKLRKRLKKLGERDSEN